MGKWRQVQICALLISTLSGGEWPDWRHSFLPPSETAVNIHQIGEWPQNHKGRSGKNITFNATVYQTSISMSHNLHPSHYTNWAKPAQVLQRHYQKSLPCHANVVSSHIVKSVNFSTGRPTKHPLSRTSEWHLTACSLDERDAWHTHLPALSLLICLPAVISDITNIFNLAAIVNRAATQFRALVSLKPSECGSASIF